MKPLYAENMDVGIELTRRIEAGAWRALDPKLFVAEKSVVLVVRSGGARAGVTFNETEIARAKTDPSTFAAKMRHFAEDVRHLEWHARHGG